MAKGFIDSKAHPTAMAHYAWYPLEPSLRSHHNWLAIVTRYDMPHMTLVDLLENIPRKCSVGDDVLIVCHGTDRSLSIPLFPGTQAKVNPLFVNMLFHSPDTFIPEQVNPAMVERLTRAKDAVKKKELAHVAFRACKMGNSDPLLAALKKLFGCQSISAPFLRDAHAPFKPEVFNSTTKYETYKKKHPNAKDRVLTEYGESPNRLVTYVKYWTDKEGHDHFKVEGAAESKKGVQDWIDTMFSPYLDPYQEGQTLYLHAMFNRPLLYPRQPEYAQNLYYFLKPKEWYE
jgi:hypothetical protein